MDPLPNRRFVTAGERVVEPTEFTLNEWLSRADVVPCQQLLLVRATMEPGRSHPFHCHPTREEIIYVISGQAEQWCGTQYRILQPGEMVLIPEGEVHGTYNPFSQPLVFLAILSPAQAPEPAVVDVRHQEPWSTLRQRNRLAACE
jgi:quercetin dioxygenase-like cupin family protein